MKQQLAHIRPRTVRFMLCKCCMLLIQPCVSQVCCSASVSGVQARCCVARQCKRCINPSCLALGKCCKSHQPVLRACFAFTGVGRRAAGCQHTAACTLPSYCDCCRCCLRSCHNIRCVVAGTLQASSTCVLCQLSILLQREAQPRWPAGSYRCGCCVWPSLQQLHGRRTGTSATMRAAITG